MQRLRDDEEFPIESSKFSGQSGQRVTLREVAQEAGVSLKTASRAVNQERYVRPETAARVMEAASRLGYLPNELARSLKSHNSRTIGLMIADISNPFYATCASMVEEVARSHEYTVVLCASSEDAEVEHEYVEMLSRRRIEGLLLVPAADGDGYLRERQDAGLPVVTLDRPSEGAAADTVVVQNRLGTREAIEHLIGHGHRRIAFVGAQEGIYTARKRLQGYREALGDAGLPELSKLGVADSVSAAEATGKLLESSEPPTAIFAVNNLVAVGVLQALEKANLRVPEDVALIGFDDFELANVLRPRLTLVRQPAAELGRKAAELLFERLEGDLPSEPQRLVLPTELVIRESCGCNSTASA